MLKRETFKNRGEWLSARGNGFGGSDAAAVCGMSPWMTTSELWAIKTGQTEQKDISDNPAVQQGVRMEPAIRNFFKAIHPELDVEYHQFDILYQQERPWLFATLDGELTVKETGKRGVLEIKTSTPNGKAGWAEWADGNIPRQYYLQTLHQLLATGFEFVYLYAALYARNGDIILREYEIQRVDVEDDLAWLLKKEIDFWRCVERREMPPTPLML